MMVISKPFVDLKITLFCKMSLSVIVSVTLRSQVMDTKMAQHVWN